MSTRPARPGPEPRLRRIGWSRATRIVASRHPPIDLFEQRAIRAGRCAAAFRPKAVGLPVRTGHLKYHWDGRSVARHFDYETERWNPIWP